MDMELMKVVSEDLDYLSDEWTQEIDDPALRRASPVLRSLLIEGLLKKVTNYLNEEINIMTPIVSRFEDKLTDPSLVFYQSGGANYKGMEIQSVSIYNRAQSPEEIKENYNKERDLMGQNYPVRLEIFLKQTSFSISGVKINREEIIKFVANKRGGAHYDSRREPERAGAKGELEKKYMFLDKIINGEMRVADKNAVYYELLSIGQRLIKSNDVQRIRQILKNAR